MKITTKRRQGISLIVLVITIIIMIILATAVILSLSSSNITDKANKAVADTKLAQANERATMCIAEWELMTEEQKTSTMRDLLEREPGKGDVTVKKYVEEKLRESGILTETEIANEYEVAANGRVKKRTYTMVAAADETPEPINVPVPEGFTASIYEGENTVAGGFVIYETNSLTGVTKETAQTTYNQFVWVPVNDISQFVWRNGYSNNAPQSTTTWNTTNCTEPFSQTYSGVTLSLEKDDTGEYAEYNAMKKSVGKYGGFYIGRYEAGTTTPRSSSTTTTTDVLVQKGKPVYNCVGWGPSMISTTGDVLFNSKSRGKGAVELSRSMYSKDLDNETGAISTLCYGVQWDAVMEWMKDVQNTNIEPNKPYIEDSTGMGNYTESIATTGSNPSYAVKNIYDMAGNVWEWTMEAISTKYRVLRGSDLNNIGTGYPASYRYNYIPNDAYLLCGFRPSLYIK